jgi:RimJ/RimL family protein N-acetyltransferase
VPPAPEDAADRLRYGRDPEFVRMVGGSVRTMTPLTAEEAAGWVEHLAAEPYGWAVIYEGRCIGVARLHSPAPADRRVRYAVGIYDPVCRGLGLGQEITRLVLRYAFGELGLHRVDLRVFGLQRARHGLLRPLRLSRRGHRARERLGGRRLARRRDDGRTRARVSAPGRTVVSVVGRRSRLT